MPRRDHKMVARTKLKSRDLAIAFYCHAARAFNDAEHRAVGLAVGLARKAGGQALHEGGHGRHRRAARCRIDVAQLDAIPGIDVGMGFKFVQGFARSLVGKKGYDS